MHVLTAIFGYSVILKKIIKLEFFTFTTRLLSNSIAINRECYIWCITIDQSEVERCQFKFLKETVSHDVPELRLLHNCSVSHVKNPVFPINIAPLFGTGKPMMNIIIFYVSSCKSTQFDQRDNEHEVTQH